MFLAVQMLHELRIGIQRQVAAVAIILSGRRSTPDQILPFFLGGLRRICLRNGFRAYRRVAEFREHFAVLLAVVVHFEVFRTRRRYVTNQTAVFR